MTLPVDFDLSGPPVQVVELDAGDLHRTQAQAREEHQDREVANAHTA